MVEEHECGIECVAINGYVDVPLDEGKLKVFKWKDYDLKKLLHNVGAEGSLVKINFAECYYSIAKDEFGWGECRYKKSVVTGKVVDKYGQKGVAGAKVEVVVEPEAYALEAKGAGAADKQTVDATEGQTFVANSQGVFTMRLPRGKYTLNVKKGDRITQNEVIVDGAKKMILRHNYLEEELYLSDLPNCWTVGFRKKDGSLWMWGQNWNGSLGLGEVGDREDSPRMVLKDVKDVSLHTGISLAIREDNSLWTWGRYPGRQEDGKDYVTEPIKLMDHVKAIATAQSARAAIKEDGSLWMWG
ncbi:MAG: hypothetical protein K2K90_05480, partial [Lachnospiraceae bacterium]|nr:hypothetical protein [Lachnospiraceae bacterium]